MTKSGRITFYAIKEAFGIEIADKITSQYGGSFLYIPAPPKISEGHHLARLIGFVTARKVAEYAMAVSVSERASGISIKVPCGRTGFRAQLTAQMRALITSGFSAQEIARKLMVDEKTVRRHRNAIRERMVRACVLCIPDEEIATQFDVTPSHIVHVRQFTVTEIRHLAADGLSDDEIAGRFSVGKADIRRFYSVHVLNNVALIEERKNG